MDQMEKEMGLGRSLTRLKIKIDKKYAPIIKAQNLKNIKAKLNGLTNHNQREPASIEDLKSPDAKEKDSAIHHLKLEM